MIQVSRNSGGLLNKRLKAPVYPTKYGQDVHVFVFRCSLASVEIIHGYHFTGFALVIVQ